MKVSKARLWDAFVVMLIVQTYCAMHCGEWSGPVSASIFFLTLFPTFLVILLLCW